MADSSSCIKQLPPRHSKYSLVVRNYKYIVLKYEKQRQNQPRHIKALLLPLGLTTSLGHRESPPARGSTPDMDSPPSDPSPSTSDFQFVNISEPGEMKAASHRKFVRKSVASNHRRKQVLQRSSASRHGSAQRSSPECAGDRRENSSLFVLAGAIDPFRSFPIPSKPYVHVLVDHYITVYCPTLQPFGKWDSQKSPIITRLFPLAIQNAVYFHALLCIAATHFNISCGQQTFKAVACHHRGEAIKLLNEILQDGKGSVTDLVIAAAGSLAHHDIIVGDTKALENHKNGMVAMIRMRGGINKSDLDCLLKFRAYWIDMLSAYYAQTTPSLPVDGLSSLISQESPSVPLAETGFCWLLEISNPSSLTTRGFQELVSLATDIRMLGGARPSAADLYSFTGRRTWIEWELSSLESNPTSGSEEVTHFGIKKCCRLGAQIYVNIVLRKMDQGHAVLSHLANKLKNTLCQTDLRSMWEEKSELLTWALFQGGAVATEPGARKWYVSHLVSCSKLLGLQTWNDVFQLLEKFLWVSTEIERRFKHLWYEIVLGLSDFETSE